MARRKKPKRGDLPPCCIVLKEGCRPQWWKWLVSQMLGKGFYVYKKPSFYPKGPFDIFLVIPHGLRPWEEWLDLQAQAKKMGAALQLLHSPSIEALEGFIANPSVITPEVFEQENKLKESD